MEPEGQTFNRWRTAVGIRRLDRLQEPGATSDGGAPARENARWLATTFDHWQRPERLVAARRARWARWSREQARQPKSYNLLILAQFRNALHHEVRGA